MVHDYFIETVNVKTRRKKRFLGDDQERTMSQVYVKRLPKDVFRGYK